MISNEVTLLKKENEKQSKELRADDLSIIKDIMKSMSIFKVNSYDAQVIQRDLIGMAHELKLRGSSLQEAIGDDIKGFTLDIINNGSGPSIKEILLNFLSKLSGYFFVWFIGLAFGAYGRMTWEANPIIYLYYTLVVLIIFMAEGLLAPLFSTEKGIKKNLQSLISIFLFVVCTIIIYLIRDNHYITNIYGGYIIVVSGLMYLIIKYLNIKNIHILAKDKNNYIQDLIYK